jgi:hypothetical protein
MFKFLRDSLEVYLEFVTLNPEGEVGYDMEEYLQFRLGKQKMTVDDSETESESNGELLLDSKPRPSAPGQPRRLPPSRNFLTRSAYRGGSLGMHIRSGISIKTSSRVTW